MQNDLNLFFWLGTSIMISLAIMVIILVIFYQNKIGKYHNEQLKEQLRTNLIVEHKERERMAKELHDGLCSDLATIKNLVSILELSPDKNTRTEIIADLRDGVLLCYEETLRISYNLSPPQVKDNTISVLLSNYIKRVSKVSDTELTFKSNKQTFVLDEIQKLEIYRIVQELVHNIIKHSYAKKAKLSLVWQDDSVCLHLVDDGVQYSFDSQNGSRNSGLGLSNIKARIVQLQAEFTHESKEDGNDISIIIKRQEDD